MKHQLELIQKSIDLHHFDNQMQSFTLFPGIILSFLSLNAPHLSVHHKPIDHIIEINYCKEGRIGWNMGNGSSIHLGHGDFSIHTMKSCANSEIDLPSSTYKGLKLCLNLPEIEETPPPFLSQTGIDGEMLYKKFCPNGSFSSFAGNEATEKIFSFFYDQPDSLKMAYYQLKCIELLLYLYSLEPHFSHPLTAYHSEQIEIVHQIHEQMILHMDERFTIEALSKQYLMNPTTLKAVFKAVYGNSIAAHVKEHRMERAAKLLLSSDLSIAEIAKQVGYENQSKFTAAFKEYYLTLPIKYRKKR